jgi:DNA helicase-2/ATP-dependent DNA helicase PcrA
VTRAKEKLYLSDSGGFSHISKDCKEPSRFIYEIGDELLNIVKPIKEEKKESFKLRFNEKNSGDISVGDSVEHYYFGVGKVISYNEKNYTYNVKFNIGIRTLVGGVLEKV